MPKQVADIRDFLQKTKRKDARHVTILRTSPPSSRPSLSSSAVGGGGGSESITKFKLRCSRYLYTLVVSDKEKAAKIESSLHPTLKKINVKDARKTSSTAKK